MLSKTGIASLIIGLAIVVGTYFYAFASAGPWIMFVVTVQGAIVLLGLFLILIGALMLAI